MFYSKEKFDLQVDEILSNTSSLSKDHFEKLYHIAKEELDEGLELVDYIMNSLFKHHYTDLILVDWYFFNTPVGEVILTIKSGSPEKIYYAADVAKLMDCSIQYINRQANDGVIVGEKKSKVWIFKENDVNNYLVKKGYAPVVKDK